MISNLFLFKIKDTKHDCWIISNNDISLPYNQEFHAQRDCQSLKYYNASTWRKTTNVQGNIVSSYASLSLYDVFVIKGSWKVAYTEIN